MRITLFICTEHFKKSVIVVYSFQEKKQQLHVMRIKLKKNVYYPLKLSV